jgi:hypothetical protein
MACMDPIEGEKFGIAPRPVTRWVQDSRTFTTGWAGTVSGSVAQGRGVLALFRQRESHFDLNAHRNRFPIFEARFELPLLHRFERVLV